jgi:hypothetical protein
MPGTTLLWFNSSAYNIDLEIEKLEQEQLATGICEKRHSG